MLFISHDLDIVEYLCDRIVVLYLGKVMEIGPPARCSGRRCIRTRRRCSRRRRGPTRSAARAPLLQGDIPAPSTAVRLRVSHALPARQDACAATVPPLREVAPGPVQGLPCGTTCIDRSDEHRKPSR
jgi:peptide/nickel transport system ATP-binding protein